MRILKSRQKDVIETRSKAYGNYLKLKAERDKLAVVKNNVRNLTSKLRDIRTHWILK